MDTQKWSGVWRVGLNFKLVLSSFDLHLRLYACIWLIIQESGQILPQVNDQAIIVNELRRNILDVMKDRHRGIVHRTEFLQMQLRFSPLSLPLLTANIT